jgi:hypothetical protein
VVGEWSILDGYSAVNVLPNEHSYALPIIALTAHAMFLCLGYLVAFLDSNRRTFHDRIAGTVVVVADAG